MSKLELKIPPALLVIIIGLLMWQVALNTSELSFLLPFKNWLFGTFVGVGMTIAILGVVCFRRANTTVNPLTPNASSTLVKDGIYQISRNPMYLGFLLVLIGWGFILANLLSILLSFSFVLYMNFFQIIPEERALATIFGDDFSDYKRRVRRWL